MNPAKFPGSAASESVIMLAKASCGAEQLSPLYLLSG